MVSDKSMKKREERRGGDVICGEPSLVICGGHGRRRVLNLSPKDFTPLFSRVGDRA